MPGTGSTFRLSALAKRLPGATEYTEEWRSARTLPPSRDGLNASAAGTAARASINEVFSIAKGLQTQNSQGHILALA